MSDDTPKNEAVFRIQTNEVVVEGDLYERDSVKYLAVNKIVEDHGGRIEINPEVTDGAEFIILLEAQG